MPPILSLINFVCLLVCLLLVGKSNGLVNLNLSLPFKDSTLINLSKCCATGAQLKIVNNSTTCSRQLELNHFEILAPVISNFSLSGNCDDDLDCVDIAQQNGKWKLFGMQGANCELREIQNYNYFPKCCPARFAYDPRTHKCVRDDQALDVDYLQVMKIGLSECAVHNYTVTDFDQHPEAVNNQKSMKIGSKLLNYGEYCIDRKTDSANIMVRACLKADDVCGSGKAKEQCLWKCCPDGEIYVTKTKSKLSKIKNETIIRTTKKCVPSINAEINLDAISEEVIHRREDNKFAVISSDLNMGYLMFLLPEKNHFEVYADGNVKRMIDHSMRYYDSTSMVYCIEQLQTGNKTEQVIFMFHFGTDNSFEIFKSIILCTSALFAILTIVCYAILPEMQNLHGKCIMMECSFLALGSAILCYTKVFSIVQLTLCTTLAYGTIFAFLGLFAWLNIICVDMWMTFGALRGIKVKDRKSELRKFLLYSLYGFGVPTLFVSFMIFAQQTNFLPESVTPKIGRRKCYFDDDSGIDYLIYFLFPMSVMLIINVVLFVKTILYCIKVKNEIQRMRDSSSNEKCKRKNTFKADKEKMIMLLKLFLIMGIPWLFEMISSFMSFKRYFILSIIEHVIDTVNCAKGIIIFCIFILKRSVLNQLANKCGFKPLPRRSAELTSLTYTTNTH